jgi:cathepsin A (carboxypeptidase C)
MISEDAYYFFQTFFQTFTQYQSSPLFIVGESYGGHYAPAIAHRVWQGNNNRHPNTIPLKLSGLGIGNGLTNPEMQYRTLLS